MKTLRLRFTLYRIIVSFTLLTLTPVICNTVAAAAVDISDPNLRSKIEEALGKEAGDTITAADMATLSTLVARNANISDLTGLEAATNLTELELHENNISDISAISGLTNLTVLGLYRNSISDISAVSRLTNLTRLVLPANSISDISAISGLTNLTYLDLGGNRISDISPLAGLTDLRYLRLQRNRISDLSPLVANTGLRRWASVYVTGNPLSPLSYTHIPILQNRGVTVYFDSQVLPFALLKISGDNQKGTTGTALAHPYVVEAQDENGAPLAGVSVIFTVTVGGGRFSATSNMTEYAMTDENGRAESTLMLGRNLGTNTVEVSADGIEVPVIFNAISDTQPPPVDIPDPNLRAIIETALGIAAGAIITTADMATLTGTLDARWSNISDLTGLEYATNLTKLYLYDNEISDISAVSGLTNLTNLSLGNNRISDISAVSGLTNLIGLSFSYNPISDISALSGLTNLEALWLHRNEISDISAVSGLTKLKELWLGYNRISDISAVSGLTDLRWLFLGGDVLLSRVNNNISDISPIAGLANLTQLDLRANRISDISAVSGLTNLTYLNLGSNFDISDISAVSGLTNLTSLNLYENSISDISPVAGLTNLTELYLGDNRISDISPVAGLTNLPKLHLYSNRISDISPLAGATHLTELWLGNNSISDISPVAGLTNLTFLGLHTNAISDISPVAGLTNLTRLWLGGNSISDLSVVSGLTNLTGLHLWDSNISDISVVSGLTNLEYLGLSNNSISDISLISDLTRLTELHLSNNRISDISPLVANTGLGEEAYVDVRGNLLSYQSIHTDLPALQSRGIEIYFDIQPHPALLKISGDNQTGATRAALSAPFVVEVQDAKGATSVGVSVAFTVTAGGGTLSTTNITTDTNGRAQSTLTLGPNLGTHTVSVTADDIESQVIFNANADTESPPIDADVNNDGNLNVLDLIAVAASFESKGAGLTADVNRDGVVDILDLILVASLFESTPSAPSSHPQVPETLTAVVVQEWLTDAMALEVKDVIMKRGIMVLGQLLAALTPTETELLPNYPNPFNPETWIPYRLAEDAFVTLTIYDGDGHVVRTLDIGHRIAAVYESRARAIYWNGRNEFGEPVASGVYFYHLSAGDYSATRRMVILK